MFTKFTHTIRVHYSSFKCRKMRVPMPQCDLKPLIAIRVYLFLYVESPLHEHSWLRHERALEIYFLDRGSHKKINGDHKHLPTFNTSITRFQFEKKLIWCTFRYLKHVNYHYYSDKLGMFTPSGLSRHINDQRLLVCMHWNYIF